MGFADMNLFFIRTGHSHLGTIGGNNPQVNNIDHMSGYKTAIFHLGFTFLVAFIPVSEREDLGIGGHVEWKGEVSALLVVFDEKLDGVWIIDGKSPPDKIPFLRFTGFTQFPQRGNRNTVLGTAVYIQ